MRSSSSSDRKRPKSDSQLPIMQGEQRINPAYRSQSTGSLVSSFLSQQELLDALLAPNSLPNPLGPPGLNEIASFAPTAGLFPSSSYSFPEARSYNPQVPFQEHNCNIKLEEGTLVQGHVDGSFGSGYFISVYANGRCMRGVLLEDVTDSAQTVQDALFSSQAPAIPSSWSPFTPPTGRPPKPTRHGHAPRPRVYTPDHLMAPSSLEDISASSSSSVSANPLFTFAPISLSLDEHISPPEPPPFSMHSSFSPPPLFSLPPLSSNPSPFRGPLPFSLAADVSTPDLSLNPDLSLTPDLSMTPDLSLGDLSPPLDQPQSSSTSKPPPTKRPRRVRTVIQDGQPVEVTPCSCHRKKCMTCRSCLERHCKCPKPESYFYRKAPSVESSPMRTSSPSPPTVASRQPSPGPSAPFSFAQLLSFPSQPEFSMLDTPVSGQLSMLDTPLSGQLLSGQLLLAAPDLSPSPSETSMSMFQGMDLVFGNIKSEP
mmetsp:Transcript_16600/g.27206  ORF Transcript_16600/g.27206 Transcript_16600/m.27206 type:complete len:483 (+) Transcript_16600:377-1825(+)